MMPQSLRLLECSGLPVSDVQRGLYYGPVSWVRFNEENATHAVGSAS
jgi:hypothetical protein